MMTMAAVDRSAHHYVTLEFDDSGRAVRGESPPSASIPPQEARSAHIVIVVQFSNSIGSGGLESSSL